MRVVLLVSRRHDFQAKGKGEVYMVCAECGKDEWVDVAFDGEDPCLVWEAINLSDWIESEDDIYCSWGCAEVFYD
jgi:hypothetical protein